MNYKGSLLEITYKDLYWIFICQTQLVFEKLFDPIDTDSILTQEGLCSSSLSAIHIFPICFSYMWRFKTSNPNHLYLYHYRTGIYHLWLSHTSPVFLDKAQSIQYLVCIYSQYVSGGEDLKECIYHTMFLKINLKSFH